MAPGQHEGREEPRRDRRKVVVTGIGPVTPVGTGVEKFWAGLTGGRNGVREISRFPTDDLPVKVAGDVHDFDPSVWLDPKEIRRTDRFSHYAIAAGKIAWEDAGAPEVPSERGGIVFGTGIGGIETLLVQHSVLLEKGPGRVSPFMVPALMANAAAGHLAMKYGFTGPNYCTVSACASSNHAIGEGMRLIRDGYLDVCISGGSEAATLILESEEHAKARGARIYCEVAGYGMSDDAHHITAPDPKGSGAALAMRWALADAGEEPASVRYVNAHGTSTPLNDASETVAIKAVLGDEIAHRVAISSTKSMTGHMLGAAGAVEGAVCALAIDRGAVPPTIHYETPDPDCDLDYVPNAARELDVTLALSNSFGFGGQNACVAFRRVA